jgi:integrase
MMESFGSAWEGNQDDFEKQNVFIQVQNGKPIRVDTPTHKFRELLDHYNASCKDESQKLPTIRLHDLRHTMITYLLANGLDPMTASKRAGHSKPSTTMDIYGEVLKSQDRKAANMLESMFFKPTGSDSSLE